MFVQHWLQRMYERAAWSRSTYCCRKSPAIRARRISRMPLQTESLECRMMLSADGFSFDTQIAPEYSVGALPQDVASADLDGDGDIDLVAANSNGNSVSILLNNADGTFQAPIHIPVGTRPVKLEVGDLDLDGDRDIVTVSATSGSVSVLQNSGNGTFLPAVSFPIATSLVSMVLVDIDTDGRLDVATLHSSPGSVQIHRNLGDLEFANSVSYSVVGNTSSIASGDFNSDGKPDLATTSRVDGTASVLINNGNGTFAGNVEYTIGSTPRDVAAGDFDGDGHTDLIAIYENFSQTRLGFLKNEGDGTFADVAWSLLPENSQKVTGVDLDLDGDLDVVATNPFRSFVSVLRNDRAGSFNIVPEIYEAGQTLAATVKDFDGDGMPDIAVANSVGSVAIIFNQGETGFAAQRAVIGGNVATAADLDGDGLLDILTGDGGYLKVMLQVGERQFAYAGERSIGFPVRAIEVGDFNSDGHVDAIVATTDGRFVSVLFGSGEGWFLNPDNISTQTRISAITAGHFNNDALLDFALATLDTSSVIVMLNQGDGEFLAQTAVGLTSASLDIESADIDLDGDVDVIVANTASDTVAILLNDGNGVLSVNDTYSVSIDATNQPWSIAIGDFDGINGIDIAVASTSLNTNSRRAVSVLLNNGTGQYLPQTIYDVPQIPVDLVAADLDADGDLDLATASDAGAAISFLQNRGDGTFEIRDDLSLGHHPGRLFAADIDADGGVDLLASNLIEETTSVLFQNGSFVIELPDLIAESIVLDASSLVFGDTLTARYTVRNSGPGIVQDGWVDTVYVSLDNQWDPSDIPLQRVFRSSRLVAGAAASQTVSFVIPALEGIAAGAAHILVRTDTGNDIEELVEVNPATGAAIELELDVTPLMLDVAQAGEVDASEYRYYQIAYQVGQRLNVALTDIPANGIVELYARRDAVPLANQFDIAVRTPFADEQFFSLAPVTHSGTLFIAVRARSLNTSATTFTLKVDSSDYVVTTRDFGVGGNAGNVTIRAEGVGLEHTNSVTISDQSGIVRTAHQLILADDGALLATFDMLGQALGVFDVVFTKANGHSATIEDGLTIAAANNGSIVASILAPSAVRRDYEYTFGVEWVNTSLNDALVPLLTVGQTVPFGPEIFKYTFGTQHTFLGTNTQGGPAGILRPGQREVITFWAYSHFAPGEFSVTLGTELKDPDAAFDWSKYRERIRPAELTEAEFSPIFENVIAQVGSTNGEVLRALSRNATLLAGGPFDNRNVNELLSLEVTRALAATTTSITGKLVSDDSGVSLGGLTVQLRGGEFSGTFVTETLTDGTFIVPGLPAGTFEIEVEGLLVDPSTTQVTVAGGQHLQGAEVNVSIGGMISGRITMAVDVPVEGATIQVLSADHPPASVATDSNGEFRAAGLSTGNYTLVVEAPDFARKILNVTVAQAKLELGDVSISAGGSIQGTVRTADGLGLTTGVVTLHKAGENSVGHSAPVSAGSYSLDHIPAGQYVLSVLTDNVIRARVESVTVTDGGPATEVAAITLANVGSVQGQVVLPGGASDFTGFLVAIVNQDETVAATYVQSDGSFAFPSVASGNLLVRLIGQFYGEVPISLSPGENLTGLQLNAAAGASVSGRVQNSTTLLPLSGVTISMFDDQGHRLATSSASDGSYQFHNVLPGHYVLSIPGAGAAGTRSFTIVAFGQYLTDQDFSVPIAARLSGRVLIDGQPASNAAVQIYREGSLVGESTTDTTGLASFLLLQSGIYIMRASASDGTFSAVTGIQVNPGADVNIDVDSGLAKLNVQVQAVGGTPAAGVEVSVYSPTGAVLVGTTNSVGTLQFGHLVPGTYLVRVVSGAASGESEVAVNALQTVSATIVLQQQQSVSGIVTNQAGSPVSNAIVELIDAASSQSIHTALTDANGMYAFSSVEQGMYELSAYGNGLRRTSTAPFIVAGNASVNLTVATATAFLSGRVVSQGIAVADATVSVINGEGQLLGSQGAASDGTFEVEADIGSSITVTVSAPGMQGVTMNAPLLVDGINTLGDVVLAAVAVVASNSDASLTDISGHGLSAAPLDESLGFSFDVSTSSASGFPMAAPAFFYGIQNWFSDFLDWISEPELTDTHTQLPPPIADPCHQKHCGAEFVALVNAVGAQQRAYRKAENTSRQITGVAGEYYARITQLTADAIALGLTFASLLPSVGTLAIGAPAAFGNSAVGVVILQSVVSIERLLVDARNTSNSFKGISTPEDAIAIGLQGAGAATTLASATADTIAALKPTYEQAKAAYEAQFEYLARVDPEAIQGLNLPDEVGKLKTYFSRAGFVFGAVSFAADLYKNITTDLVTLSRLLKQARDQYKKDYGEYERAARKAHVLEAKLNACLATPCDEEGEEDERKRILRPGPIDPNDITGPAAFGPANHLKLHTMPYLIRFENDAVLATAPAALVRITQQLDPDLDWTTFRLGDIGFGDTLISVPENTSVFETRVDLTATHGVFVDVSAGINLTTGEVSWQLIAIDPETNDLPVDPLVGFLPPNVDSPEGEGFVNYTIRPKQSVGTGVRIDAVAAIVFDVNDPILTPAIFHTLDVGVPDSSVLPLDEMTYLETFPVSWAGTDDTQGSGIQAYDVYVSEDAGPFTRWLTATTATSGMYNGHSGKSYAFYSVATDNVGFRQETPASAQAMTIVSANSNPSVTVTGETVYVKNQPPLSIGTTLTVTDLDENLSGGSLRLSITDLAFGKKQKRFDVINAASLSSVGVVATPQFINGRIELIVQLNQAVSAAQVTQALRSVTFLTSGKGLKTSTRSITTEVIDAVGATSNFFTHTIRVLKKSPSPRSARTVLPRSR